MSGAKTVGQDVRFLSALCWIWCPDNDENDKFNAECIDGDSGLLHPYTDSDIAHDSSAEKYSSASTFMLTKQFLNVVQRMGEDKDEKVELSLQVEPVMTLDALRELKRQASPKYEAAKDLLLHEHNVFYQWNRRDARR